MALRRQIKQGPARLAADLQRLHGITIARATVHRILVRRGRNRLRDLDPPTGEQLCDAIRYENDRVGDLIHIDIKTGSCVVRRTLTWSSAAPISARNWPRAKASSASTSSRKPESLVPA